MKNLFTFLIVILMTFTSALQAQVVDSVVVRLTEQSTDSINWTFYTQDIDSFSLGKIKTYYGREFVNNTWGNKWLTAYTHSSTVDSVTSQQWTGQWNNYFRYIYYHNAQGLDTVTYWIRWYMGNWINQTKYECTYNADSSMATRITSNWNTTINTWELDTYEYWSKDAMQRDTSITMDRYVSGNWEPYRRESFTYDSLDNRITAQGNYWDSGDSTYWLTYYSSSWSYDSLNRTIGSTIGLIPGGHGHSYYFYYPDNNLSDDWSYWEQNSGDETWTHTHYYNDLANNVYAFVPNDYSVCKNDSTPIGGFAFGGQQPLHFSWSPSTGLSSDTVENPMIYSDSASTYLFVVTDANNNTSSDSVQVGINLPPVIDSIASLPASCIGCTDGTFTISTTSNIHYLTITPDPGAIFFGYQISGLPSGVYTICLEDQSGCLTCVLDSIGVNTGIPENLAQEIYITVNPFSAYTDIHCNMISDKLKLDIYDGLGRKVSEKKLTAPITRIYRSDLKSGVYYGIISVDKELLGRMKLVVVD